jgi:type I restriction enzyme M protein
VERIQQLGTRYSETVNDIESHLTTLEAQVRAHLADMGVKQ